MLKERRHSLIIQRLRNTGDASIVELSKAVGVSTSTVYRDLKWLSDRGVLQMTRGGAVLPAHHLATFELDSKVAAGLAAREKALIAADAAEMIEPGQTVLFDSSTTVLAAARLVAKREIPVTGVTNSLEIGTALAASRAIDVIVVGGSVRTGSTTLIGVPGLPFLANLHADVAFLGTHAITGRILTETSLDVAGMKQAMIRAARRVIVLADSSKFQPPAFFTICDVSEIHELVTDPGADAAGVALLRDAGVKVRIAGQ